jgi:hypothetical protein
MGTPLTSATVSSTYQALLKTSDNSALALTPYSFISDGLGNDTPLLISRKGVTGTGNINATESNTAFGFDALAANTSGNSCTAIGFYALSATTGALDSIAIGSGAMEIATTVAQSIAIGNNAGRVLSSNNNILIGHNCISANDTSGTIAIGNNITASATSGLALGHGAAITSVGQVAIGSAASPLGTLTTETVSSTRTWTISLNGVTRKILLA